MALALRMRHSYGIARRRSIALRGHAYAPLPRRGIITISRA